MGTGMKRVWLAAFVSTVLVVIVLVAGDAIVREREYQALIARGEAALSSGQTYQAIEAFSGAIALRDSSMIAYLKRGEAYRQRGESSSALRDLRVAARLAPSAVRTAELLGDVNYGLERYERAVEDYRAFVALDERSPRVQYKLALALFRNGEAASAIAPLRTAITLDGRLAEAHYVLGLCLKDTRRSKEASDAFSDAVRLSPAFVAAREELAAIFIAQGRTRQAIEQLEAIAALEPGRPERQTAVALAYAGSGQTSTAVTVLGRAAERYPDDTGVFVALGRVWLEAAEPKRDRMAISKALEALEPIARRPGAGSEALALFGRAQLLAGDAARAEATLWQASLSVPIRLESLLWHADAAERLGRLNVARESLRRWTVLAPDAHANRPPVFERIGDLAARLGDPSAALRAFEQAALGPTPSARMWAKLASAQLSRGDAAAARVSIERGLGFFPRDSGLAALQRRLR
jgi:tetratricopeptide (TPR) repeat protein